MLARSIAFLSEPGPLSLELVTVKTAGAPSTADATDRFAVTRNRVNVDKFDLIGASTMAGDPSFDRALPGAAIKKTVNAEKTGDAIPNSSDARIK
jgi:hypothetical protein